ncbi:MAG TPA: hypothetical protein VL754_01650 [Verrucomicrobiae bacterium]|jgi:hypothetical protein|nr:hypothetical protein [Verrucomicrobiae bacterium]
MSKSKRKAKKLPPAEVIYRPPTELAEDDEELSELRAIFADLNNPKQRAFLAAFVRAKGVRQAARLSGVCRNSHYKWMKEDDDYCERFERAKEMLADDAEEEVFRRAFHGYYTPIIYGGKVKGWAKTYSDALAMFTLRGLKPRVYRNNADPEFVGGPTSMEITILKEGEPKPELSPLPVISIPRDEPEE